MSQALDQRKAALVSRVAGTRLELVNSAAAAQDALHDRMKALHLSADVLKIGAAAGAGVLLSGAALRLLRPKPAAVAVAAARSNPWTGLAIQLISALALPLAQQYLLGKKEWPSLPEMPKLPKMPHIDLNLLFYRWLGLIK